MGESPKQTRALQPETNDVNVVVDLFFENLLKECGDILPVDQETLDQLKAICFSAVITGVDWSLTQSPKALAKMLQELGAIDVE